MVISRIPWNSLQYLRIRMWEEGDSSERDDWKSGWDFMELGRSLMQGKLPRLLAGVDT